MNTSELIVENTDLELAKENCKTILDNNIRSRAVANNFAVIVAAKYFDSEKYDIDTSSGLHNIPIVHSSIDIADLYIDGNYIDIRIFFENDTLSIPVSHFENNILPIAYSFIKIDSDFSNAEVIGFIRPDDVNTDNKYNDQILISEEDLTSFYDIEPYLIKNEEFIEIKDSLITSYLESKTIDKELFQNLIKSRDARLRLAKLAKAQYIFNFVSISKDLSISENTNNEITELFDTSKNDDLDFNLQDDIQISDNLNLEIENSSLDNEDLNFNSDNNIEINMEENFDIDSDNLLELDSSNEESLNLTDSNLIDEVSEISLENNVSLNNTLENTTIDNEISSFSDEVIDSPSINTINTSIEDNNTLIENSIELTTENFDESKNTEINDKTDFTNEINGERLTINETYESQDFKTMTTPSLNIESDSIYNDLIEEKEEESISENDVKENNDNILGQDLVENDNSDKKEQINSLFTNEVNSEESDNNNPENEVSEISTQTNNNKNSMLVHIIGLVAIFGSLGYFGYTKFFIPQESVSDNSITTDIITPKPETKVKTPDPMPIETVETSSANEMDINETISPTVPTIEQNLDASILVSNLKVDWEVPSGYVTNTSAKRYLVKLGKILQLNLKTELLLLNKPPITNKIGVEIKFNNNTKKFEPVGISISSGEQSVDDLILNTVKNTLSMNLSINTDSISKLQGNPILMIHL